MASAQPEPERHDCRNSSMSQLECGDCLSSLVAGTVECIRVKVVMVVIKKIPERKKNMPHI